MTETFTRVLVRVSRPDIRLQALAAFAFGLLAVCGGYLVGLLASRMDRSNHTDADQKDRRDEHERKGAIPTAGCWACCSCSAQNGTPSRSSEFPFKRSRT